MGANKPSFRQIQDALKHPGDANPSIELANAKYSVSTKRLLSDSECTVLETEGETPPPFGWLLHVVNTLRARSQFGAVIIPKISLAQSSPYKIAHIDDGVIELSGIEGVNFLEITNIEGYGDKIALDIFGDSDFFIDTLSELGIICKKMNLRVISSDEKRQMRAFDELIEASGLNEISEEQKSSLFRIFSRAADAVREGRAHDLVVEHKSINYETVVWPEEKYSDAHKGKGENIVEFLERVWKPLIQAGATRVDLRRADRSADMAVNNYTAIRSDGSGKVLPPELHLPTKKELNDRLASQSPGVPTKVLEGLLAARKRSPN
ncbi:hypothetical protein [Leisingera sp. S232]|uniref:hypothetical protein n=1 Tax=Leisingera sp. S232 TaxID=3415132 RepID=UPI003C7D254E